MCEAKKNRRPLFDEFPPVSSAEWEAILKRDLNGADYHEKLLWETLEGISVLPFYRREDLNLLKHMQNDLIPDTPAKWSLSETIVAKNSTEANHLAIEAVKNGVDNIRFTIQPESDEGMLGGNLRGTQVQSLKDIDKLLNGIDLTKTGLLFDSGMGSAGVLGLLKAYLNYTPGKSQNVHDPAISFLFDPFTYLAEHGRLPLPERNLDSLITQMAAQKSFTTLAVNGSFYHHCGATIVQEIGISLAIGSEFLARVPRDERENAARQIWMQLSAGTLYFPEIAKFRAVRLLWDRILDGYEIDNRQALTIHACTSLWNKSAADPYINMLRSTTEAMASIVGGADTVTIHPFNLPFDQPSLFSRRIARNVSHILQNESYLNRVKNPADGSFYIESLTDQIALKSWEFFQLIEKAGGFKKAVEAKMVQSEIGRSQKSKDEALATRKCVLTGVNNYADSKEKIPEPLFNSTPVDSMSQSDTDPEIDNDNLIESFSEAFKQDALLGDVVSSFLRPQKQLYPALKPYRAAHRFEKIRVATQNFEQKRGKDVNVQLVPVGEPKMRKARAGFSTNFLSCAGFKIDNPPGFKTIEEAAGKLNDSDTDIFVLCGSDNAYPDLVKPFCEHFGDNNITILAGNPKEKAGHYKDSGIDFFIYTGLNMIEVLEEIQEKIEMTG